MIFWICFWIIFLPMVIIFPIKKVGKKDTINGVTSNWVFITFVGDAYNTKGKKIYYKTEGWLFGGVLD